MDLISVIMSTYKEPVDWIRKAVDSIVGQSYKNIEFIIVIDDPTNQDAVQYIRQCQVRYPFVHVIENSENIGLVESLNKALAHCGGDYIARMDADDIALPERIERELEYLRENHLDIVGAAYRTFYGDEIYEADRNPASPEICAKMLRYRNCTVHPTWVVRKEVYTALGGYRHIDACEDFDFLVRAALSGFRIGNTPEVLLMYRNNTESISHLKSYKQKATMLRITKAYRKGEILTMEDYRKFIENELDSASNELMSVEHYTKEIKGAKQIGRKLCLAAKYLITSRAFRKEKLENQIVKQLRKAVK